MAASDPADCKGPAGALRPVVDRNRCEGKADCVRVCPEHVFAVGKIDPADRALLSLMGRIKSLAHRGRTAYATRADACMGCGLCVTACPKDAITLARGDD